MMMHNTMNHLELFDSTIYVQISGRYYKIFTLDHFVARGSYSITHNVYLDCFFVFFVPPFPLIPLESIYD